MKLYTYPSAPNPRRVHIYLQEKGLGIPQVTVNIRAGEQRSPEFLQKNPLGAVPVLELDDGRTLTESLAIMEYLEELHPEPSLIGRNAWQRARTREAERIAEMGLLQSVVSSVQQFAPSSLERITAAPELVQASRKRFAQVLSVVDRMLAERRWLAGEEFSIADITAVVAVEAAMVGGFPLDPALHNVSRWLSAVRARPSVKAS
ncbi:MAG: glutathione S-transferase family protein [Myxococcota bacterium]